MKNLFHIIFKQYKCYVTAALVLINIAVFLWMFLQEPVFDSAFMYSCGAIVPRMLDSGEYYRFLTASFLHFDLQHLGNNMLMLALIGSTSERYLGSISFLLVYITGAIAANLFASWNYLRIGANVVTAGASGAVFAIIGALLGLVLVHKGKLENFTTRKVVIFIVLILYQGFTSENVDNYAHAGGLIAGFIIGAFCLVLQHIKKKMIEGNDRTL